jgi:hypothetical protein
VSNREKLREARIPYRDNGAPADIEVLESEVKVLKTKLKKYQAERFEAEAHRIGIFVFHATPTGRYGFGQRHGRPKNPKGGFESVYYD